VKDKLFVTTSIPYVNAEPHIGFALELVQADVIARRARLAGRHVRFQTGTDENAYKNVIAAERLGLTIHELVDRNAGKFRDLAQALAISADDFIRTTEPRHGTGVVAFWKAVRREDIALRDYRGLYCHGCEDFYLEQDLVDSKCPDHGTAPAEVAERNYFFRLDAYQAWLEQLLERNEVEVVPVSRKNEVLAFVRRGLRAFSISRSSARTRGWGTPVPGDEGQTVYVWVDALINYISALGYGTGNSWESWWHPDVEKIHVIGKNVWKFHAIYWPALLKSVGLPLPDKILVHGFVTVDGQKIGKSLGNAVDPFALIQRFGCDAIRYYLLRAIPTFGDGDFSLARLEELYETDLANGIGNLVSRVAALCIKADVASPTPDWTGLLPKLPQAVREAPEFDRALESLWDLIREVNQDIDRERPWKLSADSDRPRLHALLNSWLAKISVLVAGLEPFLPETSCRIRESLFSGKVEKPTLFPRL
jgi:methionyl-tRNA synthetase